MPNAGITSADETLATIIAICNEYSDGHDMLDYIKNIVIGKEQWVPPNKR